MELEKYTMGIGDRFGLQGEAQLLAFRMAADAGFRIVPVWNKSNREHAITGTSPGDVRREADDAVNALLWKSSYYVDADHIGMGTVEKFISSSDFYTIDVADFIGGKADGGAAAAFISDMARYRGALTIPGVAGTFAVTDGLLAGIADRYLYAVMEAGSVYRLIESRKGKGKFVTEISLDEAETPQTPIELFFILAAIAREGIPVQTIAPKFTGTFPKGIDYVGDVANFTREFEDDIAVVAHAVKAFGLPRTLKLSVHSGSDKFSIYPAIHAAMKKFDAGIHIKTAGTTWLEEVIGLATSGGDGLAISKEIYAKAFARFDELCKPYLTVLAIDRKQLPDPGRVASWSAGEFAAALRHDRTEPRYNVHFRQLIHVGYRIASEMGGAFTSAVIRHRTAIAGAVTDNLFDRHIRPLFLGLPAQGRSATHGGGAVRAAAS
jgi:hypothetical protein